MARKNLPSNVEAEKSVLGGMLMDESSCSIAVASLSETSFSDDDPRNRLVFRAIKNLSSRNLPIDAVSVHDELVNLKLDIEVGSPEYLLELIDSCVLVSNIDHYIRILKEQENLRDLLIAIRDIDKKSADGVEDIGDFIAIANERIAHIASNRQVSDFFSSKDVAKTVENNINIRARTSNQGITGVNTGYKNLNELTHGWQKGNLIILAARPSVGKTAFAMNLAYKCAEKNNRTVAFFSLEMSKESIMERLLACESNVKGDQIQSANYLTNNEKVSIKNALDKISRVPLYFDDTPDSLLGDVIAKAKKLKERNPDLALIVIDYLGKIRYSKTTKLDQKTAETGFVSNSLKNLARQLDVPIICLSQLNRDVDQTESKKPTLSNLRQSGDIEQDADIVMLMYRPDYYTAIGQSVTSRKKGFQQQNQQPQPEPEEGEGEKKKENDASPVDVIVAKNRNGATKTLRYMFKKSCSCFAELSSAYQEKLAATMDIDD